jgi:hypothetical protein
MAVRAMANAIKVSKGDTIFQTLLGKELRLFVASSDPR